MLQQIAVVAGYLGDKAAGRQPETLGHRLCIALRMCDPRIRIRRKVGIVGKDMFAGYVGRKLHEQASVAQPDVQWIEDLSLIKSLLGNITLT